MSFYYSIQTDDTHAPSMNVPGILRSLAPKMHVLFSRCRCKCASANFKVPGVHFVSREDAHRNSTINGHDWDLATTGQRKIEIIFYLHMERQKLLEKNKT